MRIFGALQRKPELRQQIQKLFFNDLSISIIIFLYYLYSGLAEEQKTYDVFAEGVMLLNHILLAVFTNYFLLPRYFHKQKYWHFFGYFTISILVVGALEEGFWERIFYPKGQGAEGLNLQSLQHVIPEFMPFVLTLFGFKIAWDYHDRQRKIDQLNSERMSSELKFLKSQINPHVLFNNLNNIYSYALDNSKKVPEMVLQLSDIMRYMLYECDEDMVPLKKEINYLTNFVRLQEIQMEGRGKVDFNVIGDPDNYEIAPLLLIAFVENCFKHSMQTKIRDIHINITIRIIDGVFDFFAENNFSDKIDLEDQEGGIGLQNVKKRLDLIYGDQADLRCEKGADSFSVNLRINLKK